MNLVKDESERIDAQFLEPACGSGNFIGYILQRKLAAVELKYGQLEFERNSCADDQYPPRIGVDHADAQWR